MSDVPTVALGVMVADVLLVTDDVIVMMSTIVLGATISMVADITNYLITYWSSTDDHMTVDTNSLSLTTQLFDLVS